MFDQIEIPITCPQCGAETKKSLGWLKANNEHVCSCGTRLVFNKDEFTGPLEETTQALDDFKDIVRTINKG